MPMCKVAKYGRCLTAADKDTGDGLCRDHSNQWRRSKERRAALADPDVLAYMGLGLKTRAMMTVNRKYKVAWVKRITKTEAAQDPM